MLSSMYPEISHLWMRADAAEYVQELAGEDANIIFGAMYDDSEQMKQQSL